MTRRFRQVDVFTDRLGYGNALAVVADADDLDDEAMARFARWTNLSETTFLLAPTTADADYRVRIFTGSGELPFAGHPTLGACHAWLRWGGVPKADRVVQECQAGLVPIRRGERLAFAAPPVRRSAVPDATLDAIVAALGIARGSVVRSQVLDNGPVWTTLQLDSAETVLSVDPAAGTALPTWVGLVGPHPTGGPAAVEVRALAPGEGFVEDPVTGSLNASVAQWLVGEGVLPTSYVAAQGTALGRAGRVYVTVDEEGTWVAGDVAEGVSGSVAL